MNKLLMGLLVFLVMVSGVTSYLCLGEGNIRETPALRDVVLYDTSMTSYKAKSKDIFNTKGYFIDKKTNSKFVTSIEDKLYREFHRGNETPIELQKAVSIDTIENSQEGALYRLAGLFLHVLTIGFAGALFILELERLRKSRTKSDKKESTREPYF